MDDTLEETPQPLKEKPVLRRRSLARLVAVQAYYQLEVGEETLEQVILQFQTHHLTKQNKPFSLADKKFFVELIRGAYGAQERLDPLIQACLSDWKLNRLDCVVRAILRLGAFELSDNLHLSSAIILNEYIDVTKAFSDEKEPAFVNGVLNCLIGKLRPSPDEQKNPS